MRNKLSTWSRAAVFALAFATLGSGCGDSEDLVFISPLRAPVAVNDTVNALGNSTLTQNAVNGVLGNDSTGGASISSFDATTPNGGAVQLQADGSFTYTPATGFTGTDSFTYTLSNELGSSSATVTLNVNGLGRFVDNSLATNGNGTQASPFNNLTDALNVASSGDTIFLFRGNGTTSGQAGAFTLPAGVSLVGEGQGLILTQTIVPAGNAPVVSGPITLSGNNTVTGLTIENSASDAIVANGVSNLTIDNNTLNTPTSNHLDLDNVGGSINIRDNTFGPATTNEEYVNIDNNNTNATFTITGNRFQDDNSVIPDDGIQTDFTGTSVTTITCSDNTFTADSAVNGFDEIIEIISMDTAQTTVTASNNTANNSSREGLEVNAEDDSTVSGTVSGNNISGTTASCVEVCVSSTVASTVTISENTLANATESGIILDNDGDQNGVGTITVVNNQITGGAAGISVISNAQTQGNITALIRNNTINDSLNASVFGLISVNGNLCLDITGNTVNRNMLFDDSGAGAINVERFDAADGGPLSSVNTFSAGGAIENSPGDVVSRAAGFCTTP